MKHTRFPDSPEIRSEARAPRSHTRRFSRYRWLLSTLTLALVPATLIPSPASAIPNARTAAPTTQQSAGDYVSCACPDARSPFADLTTHSPFYKEIDWIYCMGFTTGVKSGSQRNYLPKASLSREAMAAFMYRLSGSPSVDLSTASPFVDVPRSSQFYAEIVWMHQMGYTTGIRGANGTLSFAPKAPLTREAMAAFMYRYSGSPRVTSSSRPFADVSTNNTFYRQISWMKQTGLSKGSQQSDGSYVFRGQNSLTREAMAAFIYRYEQKY